MALVVKNRRANRDYFIEDRYEAGLVLKGTEIKSIRQGKVQLADAFISLRNGEAYIKGMHIAQYDHGNRFNHEEDRDRKLLLHKHEIEKLQRAQDRQGYTVIPLGLHLRNGLAKLEIATAKGKHLYDKRESEKARTMKREMEKALKDY
ncbi:MAG TPA: SsrA-binding protein SmpB [Erysipelothrix sp.]